MLVVFLLECPSVWFSKLLVFKALPLASSGLSLCPSLGKVLFGDAAPLEDDSESRSEGSSPAFSGSVSPLLLSADPLHLSRAPWGQP